MEMLNVIDKKDPGRVAKEAIPRYVDLERFLMSGEEVFEYAGRKFSREVVTAFVIGDGFELLNQCIRPMNFNESFKRGRIGASPIIPLSIGRSPREIERGDKFKVGLLIPEYSYSFRYYVMVVDRSQPKDINDLKAIGITVNPEEKANLGIQSTASSLLTFYRIEYAGL
jgi:hypothetical protein